MRHRWTIASLAVLVFLAAATPITADGRSDAEGSPPSAFFERLSDVMTGTWEGRFTNGMFENPSSWSPVTIEYRLTANGTALIEDYIFEKGLGMTTVYHKDHRDLRLTHYCGASNHPRMIATRVGPDGTVYFDFVDVTNLAEPDAYHSRQVELTLVSRDELRIVYHGFAGGERLSQAYAMRRRGTKEDPAPR